MKDYELLDAVGGVDEKYVLNASKENGKSKKRIWIRWAAAAACICLIAGGAVIAASQHRRPSPDVVPGYNDGEDKKSDSGLVPGNNESEGKTDGKGVSIPAIKLPESGNGDMDMIGLVVYKGGIYTQAGYYAKADAEKIEPLVGERLGYATGSIDEWSKKEDYETEFAGSICGDIYSVKGYDTGFRLCIREEYEDENGEPYLFIEFLDRLNGITLEKGSDLFEDRLRIKDRVEDIKWQSHEDWNWNTGNIRDAELDSAVWEAFLDAVDEGEFVYTWNPDGSFYDGVPESHIYDTPNQAHLTLTMEDGTVIPLRLIEGGYVGYQPLGWYFVKIPGDAFDAVYDACGGTHIEDWQFEGK